ncbi:MAG: hypothetical protein JRH16_01925 [Deltaproteobacteria bacterium]|nr:hypothetical protein [Deltaproteobacteria bacterium]MBW2359300.1 hypothetical protein [Deltaproteobacteria bacterium]
MTASEMATLPMPAGMPKPRSATPRRRSASVQLRTVRISSSDGAAGAGGFARKSIAGVGAASP